jgi:hypothetical protein
MYDAYASVFSPNTPERIIGEYIGNREKIEQLRRRNRTIEREHQFQLGPAVQAALEAAQAETPKPLAAGRKRR